MTGTKTKPAWEKTAISEMTRREITNIRASEAIDRERLKEFGPDIKRRYAELERAEAEFASKGDLADVSWIHIMKNSLLGRGVRSKTPW